MVTYAVSIHAPLRGATWSARVFCNSYCCFNPRTPAGCDAHRGAGRAPRSLFQSTHPCGVRPSSSSASSARIGFNPRTPAGCDLQTREISILVDRFNPRTPAGCDWELWSNAYPLMGFNPRTPAGCDHLAFAFRRGGESVSIHAPLRGATLFGPEAASGG